MHVQLEGASGGGEAEPHGSSVVAWILGRAIGCLAFHSLHLSSDAAAVNCSVGRGAQASSCSAGSPKYLLSGFILLQLFSSLSVKCL